MGPLSAPRLSCCKQALGKNLLKVRCISTICISNHTRPIPAATIPSLFYLLLVKYPRHFWHPLLAPLAPEFPFWRQIAWVIQCPCHDISKIIHRRCTDFQDTASACGAELSVQSCATPVICFVYGRLFRLGSIGEGGDWDFCCQSECCSEKFLAILAVAERSAGIVW